MNLLFENQATDVLINRDADFEKAYATAISGSELRRRLHNRMKQWKWNEK
jgi:hypothetical protein